MNRFTNIGNDIVHKDQYSQEWKGQNSAKFKEQKQHYEHKDLFTLENPSPYQNNHFVSPFYQQTSLSPQQKPNKMSIKLGPLSHQQQINSEILNNFERERLSLVLPAKKLLKQRKHDAPNIFQRNHSDFSNRIVRKPDNFSLVQNPYSNFYMLQEQLGRKFKPQQLPGTDYTLEERINRQIRPDRMPGGQFYKIQDVIGCRQRVQNLRQMRNEIPVTALGDKAYKHTDYSPQFFQIEGGLIPGSCISSNRKGNTFEKQLKDFKRDPQKLLWKDQLQLEQSLEEREAFDELDKWESTVLIEENPNYKDPDKFFQNLQKLQINNKDKKDTQKPGKQ